VWLFGVYISTDTHRHDFNDELGDGKLFDGWDRVENKWEQYAHQVFGVEEESGEDTEDEGMVPRKPVKGKRWPRFNLPTDADDVPVKSRSTLVGGPVKSRRKRTKVKGRELDK